MREANASDLWETSSCESKEDTNLDVPTQNWDHNLYIVDHYSESDRKNVMEELDKTYRYFEKDSDNLMRQRKQYGI